MRNSGILIFVIFVLKLSHDVVSDYLKEYIKLTQEPYFVDKTVLIEALFHSNACFSFISCPRFFGKTTNLKMIRSFAQMDFDVNGNPKIGENTTASDIFRKSYLTLYRKTLDQHLGRYMTIYLNMNLDHMKNITDEGTLFTEMYKRIRECYEDYKWVLDITKEYLLAGRKKDVKIDQHQINFMDKVFNESINPKQMEYALMQLIDLVYGFFEKDIVLLIDDYDNGAQCSIGIQDLNTLLFYKSVREMILNAFKHNCGNTRPVKYAVITSVGELNYEKFFFIDPILEKRFNISYYPFLDENKLTEFFGFTVPEIDELLRKFQFGEVEKKEIEMYYKGYGTKGLKNYIYNPYSVVNYLVSKKKGLKGTELLKNYWADAVSKRILKKLIRVPKFREKLEELSRQNGSIRFDVEKYEGSQISSLIYMTSLYNKNYPEELVNELWKVFFQQGYLSHSQSDDAFILPNMEIKNDIRVFLLENPPNFNDSEETLKRRKDSWWTF